MGWDLDPIDTRARRVLLVSPAIATALFFAAQVFIAVHSDKRSSTLAAAAADAPRATPVSTRVVTQIRSVDDGSARELARVPDSEAQLLELLDKRGCVVFSAQEVEKIGTQEASFDAGEVGVITAETKLRRARLVR